MNNIDRANLNDINNNTSKSLPFGSDALEITSYDGNGNPLIIKYYVGGIVNGKVVKTVTLTYDGSDNILTYTESR